MFVKHYEGYDNELNLVSIGGYRADYQKMSNRVIEGMIAEYQSTSLRGQHVRYIIHSRP